MIAEKSRKLILVVLLIIPHGFLLSQHTSRDNYKGAWESPGSWNPSWPVPEKTITGYDITIFGYITSTGSLSFTGSANNLIINDTLVIAGNLTVNNNNRIIIGNSGILIIRGNLVMENQSSVKADGYLLLDGNLVKTSSVGQGEFTSNDNPVRIFIGGTITPADLVNNRSNFPALNCTNVSTIRYSGSSCSYGNFTDLKTDPVYSFYETTCTKPTLVINNPSPVCSPSLADLTSPQVTAGSASGIVFSYWLDAGALIPCPDPKGVPSGSYYIKGSVSPGCFEIKPVVASVNQTPVADAGPDQFLKEIFQATMAAKLLINQAGEWTVVSGSGKFSDSKSPVTRVTELKAGKNIFRWTVTSGICSSSDEMTIVVDEFFIPNVITPNGDGKNDYLCIDGADGALEISIMNRWGIVEYHRKGYKNEWDGKNDRGEEMPGDTYYYVIRFGDGAVRKGTVVIVR